MITEKMGIPTITPTYEDYFEPDPWGFQSHPDDLIRKKKIIEVCKSFNPHPYDRALDIGAGEGWITQDLPAKEIYGYEISDRAKSRFPKNVKPVGALFGKYFDLVTATGVLYSHYDCRVFYNIMYAHATRIIVTCNIKEWEHSEMQNRMYDLNNLGAQQIMEWEFPYRHYMQKLRVFQKV